MMLMRTFSPFSPFSLCPAPSAPMNSSSPFSPRGAVAIPGHNAYQASSASPRKGNDHATPTSPSPSSNNNAIANGNGNGNGPSSPFMTHRRHHQSMSSFGSFTHSFGSSAASSYIPSSSIRSGDEGEWEGHGRGRDGADNNVNEYDWHDEDAGYDYNYARATNLYRHITGGTPQSSFAALKGAGNATPGAGAKRSPERANDELYEMEM